MLRPLLAVISVLVLPVAAGAQPSYVESSLGLSEPGFETGRTELAFGDVDGDGHPDLASLGDHGNPFSGGEQGVMVWLGDGDGNWSLVQGGNLGYGGVALGDVNGDGFVDVGYGIHHNYASGDFGDQILEVALGNGTGVGWQPWDDDLATNGETWGMFGTDFADVDNDGDLDLGAIGFGAGNGLRVYLNDGDGTWSQSFVVPGGNSAQEFVFGDVNGDGNVDFAASHDTGTIYVGDGRGGFALADAGLPTPAWRDGVALGDIDGDGRDDLAFETSSGANVYVWRDGVWLDRSGSLATLGADVVLTQIADMNNDGLGDVVCLGESRTTVHLGDGAGSWTLAASVPTAAACEARALAAGVDVDHNGYADFAYVAEEDCGWLVGGTNAFHVWRESSAPTAPALYPVRPRGGEVYAPGSVHFVDWLAAVPAGEAVVTIELSTTGPAGPYVMIAAGVPSSGRHQWTVPAGAMASTNCHLRLTLHTTPEAVSVTPAPFAILVPDATGAPGDAPRPSALDLTAAPNPFNPVTTLSFTLSARGSAQVSIHDARGRLVRTLVSGERDAGRQRLVWDGRMASGEPVAAGVYLVRVITSHGEVARTTVTLAK